MRPLNLYRHPRDSLNGGRALVGAARVAALRMRAEKCDRTGRVRAKTTAFAVFEARRVGREQAKAGERASGGHRGYFAQSSQRARVLVRRWVAGLPAGTWIAR